MIEIARVLRTEGETVYLACDDSACEACPASKAFCNPKTREFTAANSKRLDLRPTQMVEVFVHPGKAIWAGFTVLMLPLLLFAGGYFLGAQLLGSGNELASVVFGLFGLAVGFGLSYVYHRMRRGKDMPEILGPARVGSRV